MEQTVVKATLGRDLGSRPSRRLRAEGILPGVVYGLNKDPQTVSVNYVELRNALNVPTGMNTVFTWTLKARRRPSWSEPFNVTRSSVW